MNSSRQNRRGLQTWCLIGFFGVVLGMGGVLARAQKVVPSPPPGPPLSPALRAHVDFAMRNDGDLWRGRAVFASEQAACAKCHLLDGTSSRAGPDLSFIGDKFPRLDLIRSILEPSASLAVGYGTTLVETKSGEEFQGVILHHDEDTEVCLNGVEAARLPRWTPGYIEVPIADEAARTLRPGRNVLAIHCRQNTGGQFIDAGLIQLIRPSSLSNAINISP